MVTGIATKLDVQHVTAVQAPTVVLQVTIEANQASAYAIQKVVRGSGCP